LEGEKQGVGEFVIFFFSEMNRLEVDGALMRRRGSVGREGKRRERVFFCERVEK